MKVKALTGAINVKRWVRIGVTAIKARPIYCDVSLK